MCQKGLCFAALTCWPGWPPLFHDTRAGVDDELPRENAVAVRFDSLFENDGGHLDARGSGFEIRGPLERERENAGGEFGRVVCVDGLGRWFAFRLVGRSGV